MLNLEVLNWDKKKVSEVEVSGDWLKEDVRKDVLYAVVRWQLARRRQGTHSSKDRGDVRGGGKKPYKQKGTGNARRGSSRSPLLRGGSVIHGPHPRDYSFHLNKKLRQLGLRSALSYIYEQGRFFVVNEIPSPRGKAKEMFHLLKGFGLSKALLIDGELGPLAERAVRNLSHFRYNTVVGLNVYDILKYDCVVVSESCLPQMAQKCGVS